MALPRALERALCEPLGDWRPDVPGLWPHCVVCRCDIRKGDRYAIWPKTNDVLCVSCTGARIGLVAA